MQPIFLQISPAALPQQTPALPELPPGPSLDRVRGPIEIPLLETWQIVTIILFGTFAIALIVWRVFQHLRTRKNRTLPTLPHSAAIAELNIAAELAANDDERFAVLSSLALRRYFETGRGIDALGRTTDEFLKGLETHALLNPDARKSLADFLRRCDRVKFAGEFLSEAARRALTESAVSLIQQCEQSPGANTTDNAQS